MIEAFGQVVLWLFCMAFVCFGIGGHIYGTKKNEDYRARHAGWERRKREAKDSGIYFDEVPPT